jgi:folate-dependent phosphoribosylglycinamide formyltransferase PurN
MRVVFLGTPAFALPSLNALISSGHQIAAVFTQPDRPKGRGKQLAESPVKSAARAAGLAIYQPERIRTPETVELLKTLAADVMVVIGYGQIIPQAIIDLPKHGILNVHASLLPKYRGAAPIQWAIANGETQTGVIIMQIDAGLDTGDMLLKASVPIGADETAPPIERAVGSTWGWAPERSIAADTDGEHSSRKTERSRSHIRAGVEKGGRVDRLVASSPPDLRSFTWVRALAWCIYDLSTSAIARAERADY